MKYNGQLALHSEQGCGSWVQFHDDRGLYEDNKQYWNWDWTINFDKKSKVNNIQIFNDIGTVVYDGPLTFSRGRHRGHVYYPNEMEYQDWCSYSLRQFKCTIETDEVVDALKKTVV